MSTDNHLRSLVFSSLSKHHEFTKVTRSSRDSSNNRRLVERMSEFGNFNSWVRSSNCGDSVEEICGGLSTSCTSVVASEESMAVREVMLELGNHSLRQGCQPCLLFCLVDFCNGCICFCSVAETCRVHDCCSSGC
jgi:hypothetical protein